MSYVFLSHSHSDKTFAYRLAAKLRRHGHIVWIDEAEILVGDSLVEKIREGLDKVDYILAILSKASVQSEWVKKELDIAINREIGAKRVIVIPILIEEVELPGFLMGKRYADFREEELFDRALTDVLTALGRGVPPPNLSNPEIAALRKELTSAKALADYYVKDAKRQRAVISRTHSPKLRVAIDKANLDFPHHRTVNEAYAFEVGTMPVTLDYVMWAIAKEESKGAIHWLR
jgi:hypothetical protein